MFILFGVGLHLHCSVVGFREGKEKCVKERVERCNGFAKDIAETPKGLECHSYDILGARMLWKPKEARILTNFIDQPV